MKQGYLGLIILGLFLGGFFYLQSNQEYKNHTDENPLVTKLKSFKLSESSKSVGINHRHERFDVHSSIYHLNKWFINLGASVSANDFDGDGFVDLFFCNGRLGSRNFLYKNINGKNFEDVTEKVGLDFKNDKNSVCFRPIFFDYNSDGLKDLFISTHYCPKLFRQEKNGMFTDVSEESGIGKHCFGSFASNILDYNMDGNLDILISGYIPKVNVFDPPSTKIMQNSSSNANNGGPTVLLKNNGDGSFSDAYEDSGLKLTGWLLAIGIYDLNEDGYPDIWFANDFGPNRLFINNRDGTFKNYSDKISYDYARSGMGVDIEDLYHKGAPVIYISQNFNPFDRISGNQIYSFKDGKEIVDQALEKKLNKCGWSWGNKFVDLNNDGYQELLIANGFISDNKSKEYWYHLAELDAAGSKVISDAKNWKPMGDYSLGGHQKNCVFLNTGDRLIDISNSSIFSDETKDSRSVAKIDFDNNGVMDIVVTNQGDAPFFYINRLNNITQWIGFDLTTSDKNTFAIGAKVKLEMKSGKIFTKQAYDSNGFTAQSDSRIHFGIGREEIKSAIVIWPDGEIESMEGFKYNTYNRIKHKKI